MTKKATLIHCALLGVIAALLFQIFAKEHSDPNAILWLSLTLGFFGLAAGINAWYGKKPTQ